MDRQIVYAGQIPLDTDVLSTNKNALIALGRLAQDILGAGTCVAGLACTQTAIPGLAVLVGPGSIYSQQVVDATPYGSIAADTTDLILKQGVQIGSTTLATAAPTTNGFSINYLIQAQYQEADATPAVLAYYNAANAAVALNGPLNSGAAQNTQRKGTIVLQAKAGVPATSGTQATPAPDGGFVGLYVVTVAHGQATVTAANIALAPGAPFILAMLGNSTLGGSAIATAATVAIAQAAAVAQAEVFASTIVTNSAASLLASATTLANTAQANATATAEVFASTIVTSEGASLLGSATTLANTAQANAIAAAEAYANGTPTAEGWQAPNDGLVIKGGVATMIASAPGTLVNFATAFPNACLAVVIVAFAANATSTVLDKSRTGFHGINGTGGQCCWIAIGT